MVDFNKMQAAIAKAAAEGPDNNKVEKGGGKYVPPAAGACLVTLIGYYEFGIHHDAGNPARKILPKDNDLCRLVFEIHGKGHDPKVLEDGTVIPERMSVDMTISRNEKAWYYKVFKQLNYDGKATHYAQLIGKMFRAHIFHVTKGETTYANLRDENGYKFAAALYNPDPLDLSVVAAFPPAKVHSELKVFLWDYCDLEQWNSLYIEGEYEAQVDDKGVVTRPAKSKNVLQDKIRSAINFPGSPIAELLEGAALELPETDLASTNEPYGDAPQADPLATGTTPNVSVDDALASL